ncbi:MAG: SMC-Scp complex subunit ScpB [Gammaproteobacteria bacterium]|nr:SMC-Scp complex subunit ScpB [Gammaproteobacteria bacterium]MCY4227806.1 SMC-Scp complex subunit ScpB [Gammaproteobacteria bacterium]MCY4312883.1 SMC-Scp complex subunit ScpB [Gammaproteobacteria bacterium]
MNQELKNIIEALLMVSDAPLSISKIQAVFGEEAAPRSEDIKEAIQQLGQECENRAVELQKIGHGYRYQTKARYAAWIRKLQIGRPPRLSRAQLETLSIIAYRQPVTRGDIEDIRGVSVSAEIMQRLLEREWIKQVGTREVPGRPALFATTPAFLAYFNLNSLSDLPPLMEQRDFADIAREIDSPLPQDLQLALDGSAADPQQDILEEQVLKALVGEPESTGHDKSQDDMKVPSD